MPNWWFEAFEFLQNSTLGLRYAHLKMDWQNLRHLPQFWDKIDCYPLWTAITWVSWVHFLYVFYVGFYLVIIWLSIFIFLAQIFKLLSQVSLGSLWVLPLLFLNSLSLLPLHCSLSALRCQSLKTVLVVIIRTLGPRQGLIKPTHSIWPCLGTLLEQKYILSVLFPLTNKKLQENLI